MIEEELIESDGFNTRLLKNGEIIQEGTFIEIWDAAKNLQWNKEDEVIIRTLHWSGKWFEFIHFVREDKEYD